MSFKKQLGDDTGMQTRVWGPAGWLFLHSIAQNYPWKPTDEQKEWYYDFFKLVGNVLPCRYCRESYQDFIKQPGSELTKYTLKNRKSLVTWLYHVHNKVNKKLDIKDKPSLKSVIDKYESFRSKCHKTVKIKKGCTDPMNGHRKKCFINIKNVDKNGNEFGKVKKVKVKKPIFSEIEITDAMRELQITDRNNVPEIKRSYRRLVLIHHPDRPGGNDEEFKKIGNAYQLLMSLNGTRFGKVKTSKKINLISIKRSTKKEKKLMATFETNGRKKVIHFGFAGMSDLTKHHDNDRKKRYISRHLKDLGTGDPSRAGYLSMFVLWNKPSLQASISDYRRRLGVYNRTGKFPTNISNFKSPGKKSKYQ